MAREREQQAPSAEDYLAYVVALFRAAERAAPDLVPTIYFLAAFSVEVALKAFLVHTHIKEPDLKRLGHDLDALLREANGRGLELTDPRVIDVINALSKPHRKHRFRYPISPSPELLHRSDYTLKMTEGLMLKIEQAIGYKP